MSNKIRSYEDPVNDALEAEVEPEFRFDPAQARKNVLPRGQRKVPVTVFLDEDIVAHFKQLAERAPSLSYQAHINQALREALTTSINAVLDDPRFVQLLDERIKAFVGKSEKPAASRKRRAA
jgi:uncharacterized protein (DUF4415 family)